MRETRLSGSEGGGFEFNRFSLPLSLVRPFGAKSKALWSLKYWQVSPRPASTWTVGFPYN